MAVLGELVAKLGADLGPLRSGFRRANRAFEDYEQRTKASLRRVTSSVFSLRSAFVGLGGALVVRQFVKTADALSLVEGRLKLVTNSAEELATVQKELLKIANDTRMAYQGTADLYARVGRVTRDLDVSQKDLLQTTKTINQALIVSGAAATEANAALIQLSQGLASGTLRGDELRSVLEQTPRLARAIADGLGVTIGQLRELGTEGELTAERVIGALLSQKDVIEREYSKMPKTVGQAWTVLGNIVDNIIKRVNDSTAATGGMIKLIEDFGNILNATFTVLENKLEALQKSGAAADLGREIREKIGGALEFTVLAIAAVSDAWLGLKEVWQILKIAYASFAEFVNKSLVWIMEKIDALLRTFQRILGGLRKDFEAAGLDTFADQFRKSHDFVAKTRISMSGITKQLKDNRYFWSGIKEEAKDTLTALASQETNLQKAKKLLVAIKDELTNIEEKAALEKAIKTVEEAGNATVDTLNMIPDENAKALEKMKKQYEDWQNDVGGIFNNFFMDLFENAGDAFENLKRDSIRIFTSMLAEMATQAIAKPIFIPMFQQAASALGFQIPGMPGVGGGLGGVPILGQALETLGLGGGAAGVGLDKLGLAGGIGKISDLLNAPLYGGPAAGFVGPPAPGAPSPVTGFNLLGAGVSGYNAYQSFQAEDYGRAVYQGVNAAMWAIPGMQPIAALMSLGDLIGLDDLASNLGEWIGDRFNDPATFRGGYGVTPGKEFDILTDPTIGFQTYLSFQDQQQTQLQDQINQTLQDTIGVTLEAISSNLNLLIKEGVIDIEDIPPNFLEDTLNRLNLELGLKEYPDIFQENLKRNLKDWHNRLVEESNRFLELPVKRLQAQMLLEQQLAPLEALRERVTGKPPEISELKATFENLTFALERLDENSESFYTDALMILSEQANIQEEIKRLTDDQLSQADSAIGIIDKMIHDLTVMSGGDVTSQAAMQMSFNEFIATLTTGTFEQQAAAASQFATFLPDYIAFQQAFGGDMSLLVDDVKTTLEGIRETIIVEKSDLLAESFTNLTEAIDQTTEQLTSMTEAFVEGLGDGGTTSEVNVTITGEVTSADMENILTNEEIIERIRAITNPGYFPGGSTGSYIP